MSRTDAYAPLARRLARSLRALDAAREQALADSRELTRACAGLIRGLHRGAWNEREARRAQQLADRLLRRAQEHPFLSHHGALVQALGEHCEALLLKAHVDKRAPPPPGRLGVPAGAYLHGLGDLVGELRRVVLARLLAGDVREAERAFDSMEKVYEALHESPPPEPLVGLRAKIDAARGLVERTRGELVTAKRAKELERKIDDVGRLLDEAEAGRTKGPKPKAKPADLDLDGAWNKS